MAKITFDYLFKVKPANNILGIEGGGTRTSALLINDTDQSILAEFSVGSGNLRLLDDEGLAALLTSIRERLPDRPNRIGIGLAGVRSASDRTRLSQAVAQT